MDKRRCYQNIGPFAHRRDFLSEIVLPLKGRNTNSPFHDSYSDSCLGPGLRRVLHELWDRRTPQVGFDSGGQHDYFRDILGTVSGLDYEFNKLEHFLSIRKRISATSNRNCTTSAISANDMSYIDFAAKSLLNLICSLKHELTVQIKVGSGNSRGNIYQTNKLVKSLEQKLNELLRKLDEFKIENGFNLCWNRCSEHTTNVKRPQWSRLNCPRMNNVDNTSHIDHCGKYLSFNKLSNNGIPVTINKPFRTHKTSLKNRNMQARQSKCFMVNNAPNHKIFRRTNSNIPSIDGQWVKSEIVKSKNSKDLQNIFMEFYDNSNSCSVQKRFPNTKKQPKRRWGVQNENFELNYSVPRYETNNKECEISRTATCSHHDIRKRAGKDSSAIYYLSGNKADSNYKNIRFRRDKKKQQNHSRVSQQNDQNRRWSKRVSFHSTSSDQTTSSTTGDGDSDSSSVIMVTDFKNAQNRHKKDLNNSRIKSVDIVGKRYNYTNRKQKNKQGKKIGKSNNVKLNKNIKSSSSLESTSNESDDVSIIPITETKSHITRSRGTRKNKGGIRINKPYAQLNRTSTKPRLQRSKRNDYNKIDRRKHKSNSAYPRGYRKQRARSRKSKDGNFLKRIGNKLSKIGIFSSKPRKIQPESESSKRSVRYTSVKPLNVHRRTPKRREIEYTRLYYPRHNRTRYKNKRHKGNSINRGKCNVCSSDSSLTELTSYNDDYSTSYSDEINTVSRDYPYFFERIPSSYEYDSENGLEEECPLYSPDTPIDPQSCDVCPPQMSSEVCDPPPSEDLADEYEIIFEKVPEPKVKRDRPNKVINKKPIKECSTIISTDSSPSSKSISSSLPENKTTRRPYVRRIRERESIRSFLPRNKISQRPHTYFRRNRHRNWTIIKKKAPPEVPAEDEVHRLRRKRRRKYIRVGSQKFQESTERVIDYDYEPFEPAKKENSPPTINTFSRGTSTEIVPPAEERFTFYPPVKDIESRGTSTEIIPLYTKRTSTSDLIRLIKAIGTNTEQLITRDMGIDPKPLKQKTPPIAIEVKSKFTNTDPINVHSMGTDARPDIPRPPVVNKATDPLFYLEQKDNMTNTDPDKKKDVTNVGTDPRPTKNLQLSSKATDPLYYLGQQVAFTNTEAAVKKNAQTETPKKPLNMSIGTGTTQISVHDQKTSYEKVKTTSRGINPTQVTMSDKGLQFDTVEVKPVVKSEFTETFTQPRIGKTTQTSFIEKPKTVVSVYAVQTQTEEVPQKPPPPILKQRKPSVLSEEVAVVELDESSSTNRSALSMQLVFEKCQKDIYKRRTNVCKPRCSGYCDRTPRVAVCDNIRSEQVILNSLSDCNVLSTTQKDKSAYSDLELTFTRPKDPLMRSKFTSDNDQQNVGKVNPGGMRKPKLRQQCEVDDYKTPLNKQNRTSIEKILKKTVGKSKSTNKAGVFDSSFTTLSSCDWKNIAKEIKFNS